MDHRNWQRTRDILICILCIGIILWAVWGVAGQFVNIIVILLLSAAVAFLLTPAVNFLVKYKIPRVLAALVVYLLVIAALSGLGSALVFSLIRQVQNFSNTIIQYVNALPDLNTFENFVSKQSGIPVGTIDLAVKQVQGEVISFAQTATTNALNIVFLVTGTLLNIFLVLVLSFYLTVDGKRIRDSIISIVPQRSMQHVLVFEDALNRVVGNYIRGQLTLAAIVGVLSAFVCLLTGLQQFALIIGVLGFLFETIPMVGPFLASVPALVISLLLPDPFPRTIWIAVCFIVIQLIESNILGPRIVGHAVGLHPVVSILALLVFAQLFGPFGALLATPIVAAMWVVLASIYRSAHGETTDQILARKRAPWTLRRPTTMPSFRGRRRTAVLEGDGGGGTHPVPAGGSSREHPKVYATPDTVHMEIEQDDHVQVGKEEEGRRVVSIERSPDHS